MAKITGKILSDIEDEVSLEVGENMATINTWDQCGERIQEEYELTAKKLNDYLTYGHIPKKENKS